MVVRVLCKLRLRFEKAEDVYILGLMELYSGEVKNPKSKLVCT